MVAWSWEPEHGGRIDQVRVAGTSIVVATMAPRDTGAPGWEHAVIYVLDAHTGVQVARRGLPDPVPVAAMLVEGECVHVVATRRGEPIFWYALSFADLSPQHRRTVLLADGVRHDDVLDAWAAPDAGLWLELDATAEPDSVRMRAYAFAGATGGPASTRLAEERPATESPPLARDACAGGRHLFVPRDGRWDGNDDKVPPEILRLNALDAPSGGDSAWAQASVSGPAAQIHALGGEGVVCAVALAEDAVRPERARIEAFAVDGVSGTLRWRAQDDRISISAHLGDAARIARRPNGELLFQSLGPDGVPCTPLVCARPDGRLDTILLGARGPYVLDAALGDLLLAHREGRDGRVEVGGFAIDHEGRVLGRRAVPRWTIDAGDLGSSPTVYAGAGAVVVRGSRAVCAVRL
ncbi:MAG TPA: hypothetical protein VKU41_09240 [Polyangiaceae bacterium]|nr:hypothetical protein [Polyangiaceae bacterium]